MKWGIRRQHAAAPTARCEEEDDGGERGSKGKGKGKVAFSFAPLSWLAKLAAKDKHGAGAAAAKRAPAPKNTAAAAAPALPSSCLPKRGSPSPAPAAVTVMPGSSSFSPPRRSTADAVVPRRRSVANDNADESIDVRRHQHGRRQARHCSVGGDSELPPLGRLIPFSLLAGGGDSPARAAPSDTDAAGVRRHRHMRRRSSRRLSVSGGGRRPSLSGRMPLPPRVRVRSPRRAVVAPAELEGLAVVRRTRDPQRAFRESMVEMIASASASGGAAVVPPRPEELERLLACYLSLNADEHHDCIVKVFRQVWFEHVSLLPSHPAGDDDALRRRHGATGHPTRRHCHRRRRVP